jgi:hypothetical protein
MRKSYNLIEAKRFFQKAENRVDVNKSKQEATTRISSHRENHIEMKTIEDMIIDTRSLLITKLMSKGWIAMIQGHQGMLSLLAIKLMDTLTVLIPTKKTLFHFNKVTKAELSIIINTQVSKKDMIRIPIRVRSQWVLEDRNIIKIHLSIINFNRALWKEQNLSIEVKNVFHRIVK